MDFLELLETRRSMRKYTDEPVSDEDLDRILLAANAAPDDFEPLMGLTIGHAAVELPPRNLSSDKLSINYL